MDNPRPAVVMVDDEKPYLDFLACMLSTNLGWTVHTFDRPQAALAALPELNVGFIVTDYYMPELNGFEFVRAARRVHPDVPMIMITGHALDLADDPLAKESALCAVLSKPFGWRELADQILQYSSAFTEPESLDQRKTAEA